MLATDVFRVVKLAVFEFINPSCEVNVLFVDVINDDRLDPFTLIKPSCVETDTFNVEILEPQFIVTGEELTLFWNNKRFKINVLSQS